MSNMSCKQLGEGVHVCYGLFIHLFIYLFIYLFICFYFLFIYFLVFGLKMFKPVSFLFPFVLVMVMNTVYIKKNTCKN